MQKWKGMHLFSLSTDTKAKQPESDDLCGIAIQYTRRRLFCFYILLFNGSLLIFHQIDPFKDKLFLLKKIQC